MNKYKIEIEIFDGNGGKLQKEGDKVIWPKDMEKEGICAWMYQGDGQHSYKVGQKFNYPEDNGKLCPWLLESMNGILQVLRLGGTLPWEYKDTPYEKVNDPEGITTEFIRCIDPTHSCVVVKIIRTKIIDQSNALH